MTCVALLPLGLPIELGEAIIVFLGLLAYLIPVIVKMVRGDEEEGAEGEPSAEGERPLPGRRKQRAPKGGGSFLEKLERRSREAQRKARGETDRARDRWRELREGNLPQARPTPQPRRDPAPRPSAPEPERQGTFARLDPGLEEVKEALDRRREELERASADLPSESGDAIAASELGGLSDLPSEDLLESRPDEAGPQRTLTTTTRRRAALRSAGVSPWRRAVVFSELYGPPLVLRSPHERPGGIPR